jgi:hypothetical protein
MTGIMIGVIGILGAAAIAAAKAPQKQTAKVRASAK